MEKTDITAMKALYGDGFVGEPRGSETEEKGQMYSIVVIVDYPLNINNAREILATNQHDFNEISLERSKPGDYASIVRTELVRHFLRGVSHPFFIRMSASTPENCQKSVYGSLDYYGMPYKTILFKHGYETAEVLESKKLEDGITEEHKDCIDRCITANALLEAEYDAVVGYPSELIEKALELSGEREQYQFKLTRTPIRK